MFKDERDEITGRIPSKEFDARLTRIYRLANPQSNPDPKYATGWLAELSGYNGRHISKVRHGTDPRKQYCGGKLFKFFKVLEQAIFLEAENRELKQKLGRRV